MTPPLVYNRSPHQPPKAHLPHDPLQNGLMARERQHTQSPGPGGPGPPPHSQQREINLKFIHMHFL